jgi:type IV secretory pathway protease TraF
MTETRPARAPPLAIMLSAIVVLASQAWTAPPVGPLILYNHSPSIPIGFYIRSHGALARGAIVTVRAADASPAEARRRRFDGPRDFFIKRVAAIGGDLVCAHGDRLDINGVLRAVRLARDTSGHVLAHWRGCRKLHGDEALLLGDTDDSYDGRYFGPVGVAAITGIWRRLF